MIIPITVILSTDDAPTKRPSGTNADDPQPGLRTKPTDAELFSQDHPYYADSCTVCPFKGSKLMALLHDLSGKRDCNSCGGVNRKLENKAKEHHKKERLEKSRKEYNSYEETKYKKDFFNEDNGGYLVTSLERIKESEKSPNEGKKYKKEHDMCLEFAQYGLRIQHLEDNKDAGTFDTYCDGIPADLKRTKGYGNIEKYTKEAYSKQNARMMLFQFDNWGPDFKKEIYNLKQRNFHGYYIITGKKGLHRF